MREKWGAFIQFLAVIIAFGALVYGICGAYNTYFGTDEVELADAMSTVFVQLGIALAGAVIGVVGVLVGNIMKR